MGSWLYSLLVFNFSFLILQCGLDVEDPTRPSPPQWVQKSLPEEWPETGIRAYGRQNQILEWYKTGVGDVASYELFQSMLVRGSANWSEFYLEAKVYIVDSQSADVIQYINEDCDIGTRYSYYLRTKNIFGTYSLPSDTITYMLVEGIQRQTMSPNGYEIQLNSERKLSWGISPSMDIEKYAITLLSKDGIFLLRAIFPPNNYWGSGDQYYIPDSIQLDTSTIYSWRVDILSDYAGGRETSGSESVWASFRYEG